MEVEGKFEDGDDELSSSEEKEASSRQLIPRTGSLDESDGEKGEFNKDPFSGGWLPRDEEDDDGHEASKEEAELYAKTVLHFSPLIQPWYMWIARIGAKATVPEPWERLENGVFTNRQNGARTREHPTSRHYLRMADYYKELGEHEQPIGLAEEEEADRAFWKMDQAAFEMDFVSESEVGSDRGKSPVGMKVVDFNPKQSFRDFATPSPGQEGPRNWSAGSWLLSEAKSFLEDRMKRPSKMPVDRIVDLGDLIMKRSGLGANSPEELISMLDGRDEKSPLRRDLEGFLDELEAIILAGVRKLLPDPMREKVKGMEEKSAALEEFPTAFQWEHASGPPPKTVEELVGLPSLDLVRGLVKEHWEADDSDLPFFAHGQSKKLTPRQVFQQCFGVGGQGKDLPPSMEVIERFLAFLPDADSEAQRHTLALPPEQGLTGVELAALTLAGTELNIKYHEAVRSKSSNPAGEAALESSENRYTTTVHLIQSALTKIMMSQKLSVGISSGGSYFFPLHLGAFPSYYGLPTCPDAWTEYGFMRGFNRLDTAMAALEDEDSQQWTILEVFGAVPLPSERNSYNGMAWLPAISDLKVIERTVFGRYSGAKVVAHPQTTTTIEEVLNKAPQALQSMRKFITHQANLIVDAPGWASSLNHSKDAEEGLRHAVQQFSQKKVVQIQEHYETSAICVEHSFRGEIQALMNFGIDLQAQHPEVLEALQEAVKDDHPEVSSKLEEALVEIKKDAGVEDSTSFEVTCGPKPHPSSSSKRELWILERLCLERKTTSVESKFVVATPDLTGTATRVEDLLLPADDRTKFKSWELVAIQDMKTIEVQLQGLQERWTEGQTLSLKLTFRRDLLPEEVAKRAREHGSTQEEGKEDEVMQKMVRLFNLNSSFKELVFEGGKMQGAGDAEVEETEALHMIRSLSAASHIDTLHVSNCSFAGDKFMTVLLNALHSQPKPLLKVLRLTWNHLSDSEERSLFLVTIASYASLEVLALHQCDLTDEDGAMLFRSLLEGANWKELDISRNSLGTETFYAITEALDGNRLPKLKRVKLGKNEMSNAFKLAERYPHIEWEGLGEQSAAQEARQKVQGMAPNMRYNDDDFERIDAMSQASCVLAEEEQQPEYSFLEDKEDDRYVFLEEMDVKFTVSPHRPNKKNWLLVVLGIEMAGGLYVVTKSDQYLDTAGQRQVVALSDADRSLAKGSRLMAIQLKQPDTSLKEAAISYLNAPPPPSAGGLMVPPESGMQMRLPHCQGVSYQVGQSYARGGMQSGYDAAYRSAAAQSRLSPLRASPQRHSSTPMRPGSHARQSHPPPEQGVPGTAAPPPVCKIDQQCANIQMQALVGRELEVTILFGRRYTSEELHDRIRSFTKLATEFAKTLSILDQSTLSLAVEKRIGRFFRRNDDMTELCYSGEVLSSLEVSALSRALPHARRLATLNLEAVGFGNEGSDRFTIADGIVALKSLITVRLSMNNFGPEAGRMIFDLLSSKDALEELELARCNLGDEVLPERLVEDGEGVFPNLRVLDLRCNNLGTQFATNFAALLQKVQGGKGTQASVSSCRKLQVLRLSDNNFENQTELAIQLGRLTALEELRMYKCNLGDVAGQHFFMGVSEVEESSSLRVVDFYGNSLGLETAGQLDKVLKADKLKHMKLFWLEDNQFDAELRQMLLQRWAEKRPIREGDTARDLRMRFGRQFAEGAPHDVEDEGWHCTDGAQETLSNDVLQDEYHVEAWTGEKWLSTVDLNDVIAQALQFPKDKQDEHLSNMTKAELEQRLARANLSGLSDKLWQQVAKFRMQEAPDTKTLNAKFQKEGSYSLSLGTLDVFFKGLTGLVGPPRQVKGSLTIAMKEEHNSQPDSKQKFTSSNGVETTSEIEWKFVNDPASYKGKKWPDRFKEGTKEARKPRTQKELEEALKKKNKQLEEANCTVLQWPEFIAGILYTGPMYEKYNLVLRAESGVPFLISRRKALCGSNKYPTTIHGINSCVIKLSKLTRVNVLWRGSTGAKLPRSFFEEDKFGLKGGIEYGFTSMTTEQDQARHYAKGKASTLFRSRMGMVNRGAEMQDLSQYPFEAEILFPPLLGMEIVDTSVEGSSLLLNTSLSLNLMSETLDQVETKRFKLLQDTALNMEMEILRACMETDATNHGPAARFARSAFDTLMQKDAKWYNDDDHFADTVLSLVDIKKDVWPMTKNNTGDRLLAAANNFHQKHGCEEVDHLNFAGKLLKAMKLPEYIWAFRRAKILNLEGSGIAVLTEATLDHVLGLERLVLRGAKNLKELPESIGRLQHLEVLDLSRSGVEKLPDALFHLRQLKTLDLTACKMEELNFDHVEKAPPEVEFGLTKLVLKEMSKLKELPNSIGRLRQLVVLDLSLSGISRLPDSLIDLGQKEKRIQLIDLTGALRLDENKLPNFLTIFEKCQKAEEKGESSSEGEKGERKYKAKQEKTDTWSTPAGEEGDPNTSAEAQQERIRKIFLMLDPERCGKIPESTFGDLLKQLELSSSDVTYWKTKLKTKDGVDYVTFLDQVMSVLPL